MFEIQVSTHIKGKTEYRVIDKDYMWLLFKQFIQCLDAHEVTVINGLTGEVLWQWVDGKFVVANGTVL